MLQRRHVLLEPNGTECLCFLAQADFANVRYCLSFQLLTKSFGSRRKLFQFLVFEAHVSDLMIVASSFLPASDNLRSVVSLLQAPKSKYPALFLKLAVKFAAS